MADQEEKNVIGALTGFSLQNLLGDLSLPAGSSLSNHLGISGIPSLSSNQIYNDNWDDAVGADEGEDWEAEIDKEMAAEGMADPEVKQEQRSPTALRQKQKKVRVVKRLVERPKSVYERFPAFEKDKVLDFSELFKGYTVRRSRIGKRLFNSATSSYISEVLLLILMSSRNDLSKKEGSTKGIPRICCWRRETASGESTSRRGHIFWEHRGWLSSCTCGMCSFSIASFNRFWFHAQERDGVSMPLHDRSFDLVLLSNWEDQIIYEPDNVENITSRAISNEKNLTTPVNKVLESGSWTQSIIWDPDAPFKDFTQLEFNHEDDIVPEERSSTYSDSFCVLPPTFTFQSWTI